MFRLLHLADLHLGYHVALPSPLKEEVCRERNGILKKAVDLALDPRMAIDMVVIAGDLFDNHRPEATFVEETIRELARLEAAGIRVVTVPGNHDEITYNDAVYRREAGRWPGILVNAPMPASVAEFTIKGYTCRLVAMAYTGGVTRIDGPLKDFPQAGEGEISLAVFHGSLDWDGGERSLPLDGAALAAAGYDYIALGHIHRGGERRLGKTLACYAGMVAGRGFADPGTGSWTIVTLGDGPARVEGVPAPTRPWQVITVDVTGMGGMEELEAEIKENLTADAITQVRLVGHVGFELDLEVLRVRLENICSYLELADETEGWAPEILDKLAAEPTIRGLFVRRLREKLSHAASPQEAETVNRALMYGLAALKGGGGSCLR
ncbi:DNA repair exonuclease [Neomoorella humiferrea]|uniref:metallophosphoesterase family protein n=1 Tax=Neomoorella humiferrea TaxID=676965 RepID=UPI003D90F4DA